MIPSSRPPGSATAHTSAQSGDTPRTSNRPPRAAQASSRHAASPGAEHRMAPSFEDSPRVVHLSARNRTGFLEITRDDSFDPTDAQSSRAPSPPRPSRRGPDASARSEARTGQTAPARPTSGRTVPAISTSAGGETVANSRSGIDAVGRAHAPPSYESLFPDRQSQSRARGLPAQVRTYTVEEAMQPRRFEFAAPPPPYSAASAAPARRAPLEQTAPVPSAPPEESIPAPLGPPPAYSPAPSAPPAEGSLASRRAARNGR